MPSTASKDDFLAERDQRQAEGEIDETHSREVSDSRRVLSSVRPR
jgi:hypothetical protein